MAAGAGSRDSGLDFHLTHCPFSVIPLVEMGKWGQGRGCLLWNQFFPFCLALYLLGATHLGWAGLSACIGGNCTLPTELAKLPDKTLNKSGEQETDPSFTFWDSLSLTHFLKTARETATANASEEQGEVELKGQSPTK